MRDLNSTVIKIKKEKEKERAAFLENFNPGSSDRLDKARFF